MSSDSVLSVPSGKSYFGASSGSWLRGADEFVGGISPNSTDKSSSLRHAVRRATEAELRAAHPAWAEARSERRRIDRESRSFITLTRLNLAVFLGERWNAAWCAAGFRRPTLRVPGQLAERACLLEFLVSALAHHPEWESPGADFTTARARAMRDALTGADARLQASRTRLRHARDARDAALTGLNFTLRQLIKELSAILKPADPRWLEFNLHQPIRQRNKSRPAASRAAGSQTSAGFSPL